jgi:hypothetical protein
MQRELSAVTARGAQVVAIGRARREAGRICAQMGVEYPCLGDPEKASYRAYGLRRAGWREIILDPMREGSEAMKKGYKVSIKGSLMRHTDWFQLPGVAIVDREGNRPLAPPSAPLGRHPVAGDRHRTRCRRRPADQVPAIRPMRRAPARAAARRRLTPASSTAMNV